MRAVQIIGYGKPFVVVETPTPRPGPGEVLLRVRASGLCSTDLHLLAGRMDLGPLPRIPGHEIAGEVVEVATGVLGWTPGMGATVALDVTCGRCRHCAAGQTQRCPHKTRIGFERDGGHAEYVAVPAANLVPLPAGLSFEEAAILPDAVACMYHCLLAQGRVGPGQRVVILGAGGLGLHGVQIARLAGAEVLATSRQAERLTAAAALGAVAFNPTGRDLAEAVVEFTGGEGADIVADCIGTQESIRTGLALTRPGGKLLVIAYLDDAFTVPSIPLFSAEREIIGCRGSTRQELVEVVRLVAAGRLRPLVGATYGLADIAAAAARLEDGAVVGRIVLTRD